jgi:hypothetical protein
MTDHSTVGEKLAELRRNRQVARDTERRRGPTDRRKSRDGDRRRPEPTKPRPEKWDST